MTTELMRAAAAGKLREVQGLVERGVDLDVMTRQHETALTYAIVWERPRVVLALLRAGCDVEKPHAKGVWSPLMYAANEGRADIVRALLRFGADPRRTFAGTRTAADVALSRGHRALARLLRAAAARERPSRHRRGSARRSVRDALKKGEDTSTGTFPRGSVKRQKRKAGTR